MIEVQLFGGPLDGLITAHSEKDYPREVIFMRLASGVQLVEDPENPLREAIQLREIVYLQSAGRRYRFKEIRDRKEAP